MGGREIAVVGAGVVGMSAALYLQRDGHKVSVIDARSPGTLTSYGNAGGIVTGAVLDPASPIRLRWSYLPRLAPWLVRFLLAGLSAQVDKSAAALAPVLAQANDAHRELAALAGVHDVLRPVGWLKVYETEKGFEDSALERRLMSRHGIKFDVLNSDELRQLEPHLAPRFVKALFQPDSGFASYPWRLVDGYGQYFAQGGGEFLHENVRRLEPREGGGVRVRSERGSARRPRLARHRARLSPEPRSRRCRRAPTARRLSRARLCNGAHAGRHPHQ